MQFGNDKSRIIRGIAIILMIAGHCNPGKIIIFAVPLFSFLVGYGYEFAKSRNLRHATKRIWHLLAHFWFILFGIFLPIAVFYTHFDVQLDKFVLNMFGLWGQFNSFCWYIYFFTLAMLTLPVFSRIIDKYNWKGLLSLLCVFGILFCIWEYNPEFSKNHFAGKLTRYFKFMPVVLTGYWLAHYKIFSKIHIKPSAKMILPALAGIVGIYFLRGIPYVKVADFAITPIFAGCVALLCDSFDTLGAKVVRIFGYLKAVLTELGVKSMHIWFVHALFFTASTRAMFRFMTPLYRDPVIKVVIVLGAAWLMSVCTMKLYDLLSNTLAKIGSAAKSRFRIA